MQKVTQILNFGFNICLVKTKILLYTVMRDNT